MVTCIHPAERFEDTASTCGVAQLEVTAATNWVENDDSKGDSNMMNLLRRQMVAKNSQRDDDVLKVEVTAALWK